MHLNQIPYTFQVSCGVPIYSREMCQNEDWTSIHPGRDWGPDWCSLSSAADSCKEFLSLQGLKKLPSKTANTETQRMRTIHGSCLWFHVSKKSINRKRDTNRMILLTSQLRDWGYSAFLHAQIQHTIAWNWLLVSSNSYWYGPLCDIMCLTNAIWS